MPPAPRTTTTRLAASVLAAATAAAAAGLAGCSSASAPSTAPATTPAATAPDTAFPNAGLSGPQLLSAFKSAAAAATSVHVVGSFDQGGSPYKVDLQLAKNGATTGSVSQAGASIPVKVVDGVVYIQLTPSFLKLEAAGNPSITPEVINLLQNKWVSSQTSLGKSLAAGFDGLLNYESFITTLATGGATTSAPASGTQSGPTSPASPTRATSPTGSASPSSSPAVDLTDLTAAGTTTYNGETVAVYKSSNGSVAYFAASGPAYLKKVVAKGSQPGTVTFTWNQPVAVTAPASPEIFST
jgi:hypothetical protein